MRAAAAIGTFECRLHAQTHILAKGGGWPTQDGGHADENLRLYNEVVGGNFADAAHDEQEKTESSADPSHKQNPFPARGPSMRDFFAKRKRSRWEMRGAVDW
jgi:hypothetical protein